MKTLFFTLAAVATLPLAAQTQRTLALALVTNDGKTKQVWIESANERTIQYRASERSLERVQAALSKTDVFFYQPDEYKQAMQLFNSQDYKAAQEKFAEAKTKYAFVDDVPGNYATLSGFYEIECARIQGDYEAMSALLAKFQPEPLLHETNKTQIQIYELFEGVKTEDWGRVDTLAKTWEDKDLAGKLRVQIEYCHGLALEGLGRLEDALIAFNKAFVADYTASEVLTRKSALACFRIYKKHPEVELAISLHGTPDENPNSAGASLLTEAAALTKLWDNALGGGEKLPAEFLLFAKYKKD